MQLLLLERKKWSIDNYAELGREGITDLVTGEAATESDVESDDESESDE